MAAAVMRAMRAVSAHALLPEEEWGCSVKLGGAGMLSIEAERYSDSLPDDPLYATSNSWLEVNYTQLVKNAADLLPRVKPGAIPLAMVKVGRSIMH
jgi:hypothetical protein